MNTSLRLVEDAGRFRIVEAFNIDDQIRSELKTPGIRTVHVMIDGNEEWGIVRENLPDHVWEIVTSSGKPFRFLNRPNSEIEGEFLDSSWCCPLCHLALKPSGAIDVLHSARLERYHCVNPACSHHHTPQHPVDFTPDTKGTRELLGARQLRIKLAIKCR